MPYTGLSLMAFCWRWWWCILRPNHATATLSWSESESCRLIHERHNGDIDIRHMADSRTEAQVEWHGMACEEDVTTGLIEDAGGIWGWNIRKERRVFMHKSGLPGGNEEAAAWSRAWWLSLISLRFQCGSEKMKRKVTLKRPYSRRIAQAWEK
jgi:hypothetical protein